MTLFQPFVDMLYVDKCLYFWVDLGVKSSSPSFTYSQKFTEESRHEANIWLLLGCFQGILSIQPDSTHGWVIWPGPSSPGASGLLNVALASVVWTSAVINAFCFKADTSQIITYRCSKTFMWGRQMRVRLSDSGVAEDRKPQPGTRQSPGYTSLPDECMSKCNGKGICAGRGPPVFADFTLLIHSSPVLCLLAN